MDLSNKCCFPSLRIDCDSSIEGNTGISSAEAYFYPLHCSMNHCVTLSFSVALCWIYFQNQIQWYILLQKDLKTKSVFGQRQSCSVFYISWTKPNSLSFPTSVFTSFLFSFFGVSYIFTHHTCRCVSCRRVQPSWGRCMLARRPKPSRAGSTRSCSAGRICWLPVRTAECKSQRRQTNSGSLLWSEINLCGWTPSSVRLGQEKNPGSLILIINDNRILMWSFWSRLWRHLSQQFMPVHEFKFINVCVCLCSFLLQGRVISGGADELSPESKEWSWGTQPQHIWLHRDGEDAVGCQKPCSWRGNIRKWDEFKSWHELNMNDNKWK